MSRSAAFLKPRDSRNLTVNFGGAWADWIAVKMAFRFFELVR